MKLCRSFVFVAFLVAVCGLGSSAWAADYYLKIGGVKGENSRVYHCPNGTCVIDGIDAGSLAAVVCDAQGNPLKSGRFSLGVTFKPAEVRESPTRASGLRESPTKASTGRTSVAAEPSGEASRIMAPRDRATGLATGRRQHSPIVFNKEWDSASSQPSRLDTPTGGENNQIVKWALEVRVDRIEMK